MTEDTESAPTNPYGSDKYVAELACKAAAGPGLKVAVLRPSLVYGPLGEEWTTRFIEGIVSGRLKRYGETGQGNANLIYAGDLGRFAALLAEVEVPQFSVYNANGADIPTFDAYFDLLSRALGLGALPLSQEGKVRSSARRQARRVGRYALRTAGPLKRLLVVVPGVAHALDALEGQLRYGVGDLPPGFFSSRTIYAIDRARKIGFVPETSVKAGVAASAEWARLSGLIPDGPHGASQAAGQGDARQTDAAQIPLKRGRLS